MESKRPIRPSGIPSSMRQPTTSSHSTTNHQSSRTPAARPITQASPQATGSKRDSGYKKYLVIIALCVSIITLITIGGSAMRLWNRFTTMTSVNGGQYQAVFLSNNMVYFGKMTDTGGEYIKLSDIYYLQVQQGAQANQQQSQQQLSLAKLGTELHGPEDAMYINRKEVLFWENLKADGKVTQAIKDYKSKQ